MSQMDKKEIKRNAVELYNEYIHGALPRRAFLRKLAGVAGGAAAASALLPMLEPNYAYGQQVAGDDPRLQTGYIEYPGSDGMVRAYSARPADQNGPLPGILVIHENRGLNAHIEDVARRLAVAGFIAFAPDALTPLGGYPGNDDDGRELQRQRDKDEMVEDFVAAVEFVRQHPDCTGKVGAVGFCFGGEVSLKLAIQLPDLAAAVAFYGVHPAASEAGAIRAPLMLHHAGLDERVNASWPNFEKALQSAGRDFVNYEYDDVNHGFHNDTTPRYDKQAAELAWQRTLDFFARQLDLDA